MVQILKTTDLNGSNGFRIDGFAGGGLAGGYSVALADVNGDGIADMMVGAPGDADHGRLYVVFGSAGGFSTHFDITTLDGTNGFYITDEIRSHDDDGWSLSNSIARLGDFDGDGTDDMIFSETANNSYDGSVFIRFGQSAFTTVNDVDTLSSTIGMRIDGIEQLGAAVGGGDINGDGKADAFLTSMGVNSGAGQIYVVFGASGLGNMNVSSINGTNGFVIDGVQNEFFGASVANAGDVNGDGITDLIAGAYGRNNYTGGAYVVFGSATPGAAIDVSTLDGTTGFRIDGNLAFSQTGSSVSGAGDVNGDGFADMIVGATQAEFGGVYAGAAYVVFGKATFGATLDLGTLDGSNGFMIQGVADRDYTGCAVSSAGDFNGDGFDDVIIGAKYANSFYGSAYVVYGKASGFDATIDLATLSAAQGFRIDTPAYDHLGASVKGGLDINGDGFADIIVGAPYTDDQYGAAYVIFGHANAAVASPDAFTITEAAVLGAGKNLFDDNGSGADSASNIVKVNGRGPNVGHQITLKSGAHLTVNADGTFSYDPNHAFDGLPGAGSGAAKTSALDTFTYAVTGGSTTTVTITVNGVDSNGDVLIGTAGDDTLDGGIGADSMTGGKGNDTYKVNDFGDAVIEKGNQGTDTVIAVTTSYTLATNLENLTHTGSTNFTGTGNAVANTITGGTGDDTLNGLGANDTLNGDAGNDTLDGGAGKDTMVGGAGNDIYIVDASSDIVTEIAGGGTDTVKTALKAYALGAEVENLTFTGTTVFTGSGNALDNVITGGAARNTFNFADGGNDTGIGGISNDTFNFGGTFTALDKIDGGAGIDTVVLDGATAVTMTATTMTNVETVLLTAGHNYGLSLNNAAIATAGTLTVDGTGLAATDTMKISGVNELDGKLIVLGGAGDDTLTAGIGGSNFTGNLGSDHLIAADGVDTFVFTAAAQSTSKDYDTVTNFNATSDYFDFKVSVKALDAAVITGRLGGSTFDSDMQTAVSPDHLNAHRAMLFTASTGSFAGATFLIVDANGVSGYQAGEDFAIRMDGINGTLTAHNFI